MTALREQGTQSDKIQIDNVINYIIVTEKTTDSFRITYGITIYEL